MQPTLSVVVSLAFEPMTIAGGVTCTTMSSLSSSNGTQLYNRPLLIHLKGQCMRESQNDLMACDGSLGFRADIKQQHKFQRRMKSAYQLEAYLIPLPQYISAQGSFPNVVLLLLVLALVRTLVSGATVDFCVSQRSPTKSVVQRQRKVLPST